MAVVVIVHVVTDAMASASAGIVKIAPPDNPLRKVRNADRGVTAMSAIAQASHAINVLTKRWMRRSPQPAGLSKLHRRRSHASSNQELRWKPSLSIKPKKAKVAVVVVAVVVDEGVAMGRVKAVSRVLSRMAYRMALWLRCQRRQSLLNRRTCRIPKAGRQSQ